VHLVTNQRHCSSPSRFGHLVDRATSPTSRPGGASRVRSRCTHCTSSAAAGESSHRRHLGLLRSTRALAPCEAAICRVAVAEQRSMDDALFADQPAQNKPTSESAVAQSDPQLRLLSCRCSLPRLGYGWRRVDRPSHCLEIRAGGSWRGSAHRAQSSVAPAGHGGEWDRTASASG